ncbi:MAG: helix-turn-helix transcriptional regulator, partial [Paludibacter sp.]|nr:helix-turn-helix transcriptional regulator [Paludibacter sp.]
DEKTFLAVVNFISDGYKKENINHDEVSIDTVIVYLRKAHDFFLDFKLPLIRKKLIEAIDECVQEQPYRKMIMKFYDDYVTEVQKHMDHENETVFPYVLNLLEGKKDPRYTIAIFEQNHENIDSKLADLKNILIKYFPAQQPNYLLNEVLFDLSACEKDLEKHNRVEDHFFVPVTETLEKKLSEKKEELSATEKTDNLTEREKEILASVVKGLTNKEIANKLFLSTHTVISHRRNITRKLEIHSTAGLTIYAIVNKLVTLDEIKSVIE